MDIDNAFRQHRARWQAFMNRCTDEDSALVAGLAEKRSKAATLTEALDAAEANANRRAAGLDSAAGMPRPAAPAVRTIKRSDFDLMDGKAKHRASLDFRSGAATLID